MEYKLFKMTDEVNDYYYTNQPLIWIELYFPNLMDFNLSYFRKYREDLFYKQWVDIKYDLNKVRLRVLKTDYDELKKYSNDNLALSVKESALANGEIQQHVDYAKNLDEIDKIIKQYHLEKVAGVTDVLSKTLKSNNTNQVHKAVFSLRMRALLLDMQQTNQDYYMNFNQDNVLDIMKINELDSSLELIQIIIQKLEKEGSTKRIDEFINFIKDDNQYYFVQQLFTNNQTAQEECISDLKSVNSKPKVYTIYEDLKKEDNDKLTIKDIVDNYINEMVQEEAILLLDEIESKFNEEQVSLADIDNE